MFLCFFISFLDDSCQANTTFFDLEFVGIAQRYRDGVIAVWTGQFDNEFVGNGTTAKIIFWPSDENVSIPI